MGKITDIHGLWITQIETSLPSYSRISNPYEPDTNSILQLKQGYGLGIGAGVNTERFASGQQSIEQEFIVLLIKQITATMNQASARASIENDILDDMATLSLDVEKSTILNNTSLCFVSKFISHSGIEIITPEDSQARFFSLELTFSTEYFEDL